MGQGLLGNEEGAHLAGAPLPSLSRVGHLRVRLWTPQRPLESKPHGRTTRRRVCHVAQNTERAYAVLPDFVARR